MSLPFDGFKAAQTGLVDMGNISVYDTAGATPAFNPFELAQYATSFSEIVLNVTWAQLQASQGSLDTSFIDSAIRQINQFNSTYNTDLGIKLRVWGGFTAPTWVKEINGAPITVTGQNAVWQVSAHDPGSVQGLLGPNSAPWSYVNLPDGTLLRHAWSNDQIVGAYADGWRVAHSLFEHHHSAL